MCLQRACPYDCRPSRIASRDYKHSGGVSVTPLNHQSSIRINKFVIITHVSTYIDRYGIHKKLRKKISMRSIDKAGVLQRNTTSTRPIHQILQLFECKEDKDCRRLQTGPSRYPSLEHERRAFGLHRLADHTQRRLKQFGPVNKLAREGWAK